MIQQSFGLSLGRIIQTCRAIEGLRQNSLAEKLKISRVLLSRFENDWEMPSDEIIRRLTRIFKLDPTILRNAKLYRKVSSAKAGDIFRLMSRKPVRVKAFKPRARNQVYA